MELTGIGGLIILVADIYAIVMILILITLIIFNNLDDTITLIIASIAIVLTSIFTYSNRRKK